MISIKLHDHDDFLLNFFFNLPQESFSWDMGSRRGMIGNYEDSTKSIIVSNKEMDEIGGVVNKLYCMYRTIFETSGQQALFEFIEEHSLPTLNAIASLTYTVRSMWTIEIDDQDKFNTMIEMASLYSGNCVSMDMSG